MSEYVFKRSLKNPYRTRCLECGEAWDKPILRKKCPNCKVLGSLVVFRRYDFPHCPSCDYPKVRESAKPRKLTPCQLCGI